MEALPQRAVGIQSIPSKASAIGWGTLSIVGLKSMEFTTFSHPRSAEVPRKLKQGDGRWLHAAGGIVPDWILPYGVWVSLDGGYGPK